RYLSVKLICVALSTWARKEPLPVVTWEGSSSQPFSLAEKFFPPPLSWPLPANATAASASTPSAKPSPSTEILFISPPCGLSPMLIRGRTEIGWVRGAARCGWEPPHARVRVSVIPTLRRDGGPLLGRWVPRPRHRNRGLAGRNSRRLAGGPRGRNRGRRGARRGAWLRARGDRRHDRGRDRRRPRRGRDAAGSQWDASPRRDPAGGRGAAGSDRTGRRAARLHPAGRLPRSGRPAGARRPAAASGAGPLCGAPQPRTRLVNPRKKLILVVIDGLTPDVFEAVDDSSAPTLAALAAAGNYRRAVSTFPSLTPVCLASTATGGGPDVHGIPHLTWYHRGERRLVEYGSSFGAIRAAGTRRAIRDAIVEMNAEHLSSDAVTLYEALEDEGLVTAPANG